MARLVLLLVLATIVATASAKIMFDRKVAPPKWTKHAVAADDTPLKFFIALRQRNLDVLEQTFWAVAEPTSPQYRQFLQPEQIMDIVRPAPHDHARAMHWLRSNGVKTIRDMGDALEVKTTVGVASELFNTRFYHFTHQSGKKIIRQWGPYSVDDQVADAIHMVAGITEFPVPRPKLKRTVNSPSIDPAVVPQTIQAVYGTPDSAQDAGNSSQGVIEWEGEYFAPLNLQAFSKEMAIPIKALPANRIIGPNEPSDPGTEAELDIQYIAAVGQGVDNWFWSNDGTAWLYGWAVDFFNATEVPLVVSMSYGWSEADQCEDGIGQSECQQLGVDSTGYVERVNAEFQKIGLRGVSLLAASGDSGANGRTDGYCTKPKLLPDYPAASPYVTSVGATQLNDAKASLPNPPPACSSIQCASGGTEVAVSYAVAQFASGGGFSNVAPTPSYQQAAVTAYLNSGVALPPTTYFNSSGRGYPDVAAFGNNVYIYESGLEGVGGTSCASPIVAGIAGLLNIAALQKDGQPLGFLNPLLYQIAAQQPSAFTDITVGDNKCTEDGCSLSCKGYECAAGWDPVTGLGTPNYPALLQYIQNNL